MEVISTTMSLQLRQNMSDILISPRIYFVSTIIQAVLKFVVHAWSQTMMATIVRLHFASIVLFLNWEYYNTIILMQRLVCAESWWVTDCHNVHYISMDMSEVEC